ncbi:isochorismatase family protein [Phyllobacterium sp. 22552]|uniref:isochorismatase family protein n=1 Tax=Phyllobacterium sp. 22552 TaxID=3453941 RepID=UPI003F859792
MKAYVPPARIGQKHLLTLVFTVLHKILLSADVNTLLVSEGETDICVLATVLGAVNLDYRVIVGA